MQICLQVLGPAQWQCLTSNKPSLSRCGHPLVPAWHLYPTLHMRCLESCEVDLLLPLLPGIATDSQFRSLAAVVSAPRLKSIHLVQLPTWIERIKSPGLYTGGTCKFASLYLHCLCVSRVPPRPFDRNGLLETRPCSNWWWTVSTPGIENVVRFSCT